MTESKTEIEKKVFGDIPFEGTHKNDLNQERYKRLIASAEKFVSISGDEVKSISYYAPDDNTHRHGAVFIDFVPAFATKDEEIRTRFAVLIAKCDKYAMSCLSGNIRVAFSISNIWEE